MIKLLGTCGAIPMAGKTACSEIIFLEPNKLALVDAGFGVAQALSLYNINMSQLNSIFITHYHADHVSDLPTVLFNYFLNSNKESITIYTPKENEDFIPNLFFKIFGHLPELIRKVKLFDPILNIVPITGETFSIDTIKITALPMKHGNIETYGLKFFLANKQVSISSDTTLCESLKHLAENCDLLIQDCAFSDQFGPNPLHAVPLQINSLLREFKIDKVLINHLMPETVGKENEMIETLRIDNNSTIQFALDGQELII